eukprot:350077-Chlamydomonas_euryale.AAC.4
MLHDRSQACSAAHAALWADAKAVPCGLSDTCRPMKRCTTATSRLRPPYEARLPQPARMRVRNLF